MVWVRFLQLIIILLVISLPIIHGTGGFYLFGDTVIPFYAESVDKYLQQWVDQQNGNFFSVNYYPFYFLYGFFDFITTDVYLKGHLLLFTLRVIAATGIYKLIKLIYGKELDFKTTLVIIFYLLSPAYYNSHLYWLIYAFIPWFFYSAIKIIKTRTITYQDILLINIIVFCSSTDLPNPKFLFHYLIIFVTCMVVALFSKKISFALFFKNKLKIILSICLSAYLIIPLGVFALNYEPIDYGGGIKKDYSNDADVSMLDYGTATTSRMIRLFNDGMGMDQDLRMEYLSNPFATLANYSFIFLIALYFLSNRNKTFYDYLLILLTILYLFFAVGPNLPFGFLYEYFVTSFPLLAFLRTTAGAVFYLSLFYALLLFAALEYFNKTYLNLLFLGCLLVSAYPMINGKYYQNWSCCNSYVDKKEHGLKIPGAYFKMKSVIDSKKLDAKVFTPTNMSYINTKWGFFGPGALYNFVYNKNFIGTDKIYSDFSKHNVGYIFQDKSLLGGQQYPMDKQKLRFIAQNDFIEFYGIENEKFLPRVYAPSEIIFKDSSLPYVPSINSAVLDPKFLISDLSLKNNPTIEYKKISPTKYRIIFHGVRGDFMFVLSERYHRLWEVSIADYPKDKLISPNANGITKRYKIFHNNENEQSTPEELNAYLNNGWITTLGDGREKEIIHYSYLGTSKNLDFIEPYTIDFISKNHYGTIQNNNLKDLRWYERAHPPSEGISHVKANVYANGWIVDWDAIKRDFPNLIISNDNGSYDMGIVVEFLPQRYFHYSVIVSLLALFITLVLLIFKPDKKSKKLLGSSL